MSVFFFNIKFVLVLMRRMKPVINFAGCYNLENYFPNFFHAYVAFWVACIHKL